MKLIYSLLLTLWVFPALAQQVPLTRSISSARRELDEWKRAHTSEEDTRQSLDLYEKLTNLYIEQSDSYDDSDGDLDSAYYYNDLHLKAAVALGYELAEADALTLKGRIAHLDLHYRESYLANYQAYNLYLKYPPDQCRYLFECLKRMGRIQYTTLEDYPQALRFFEKGEQISRTDEQRAFMLRQVGLCYRKMNKPKVAKQYFERALGLARKANRTYEIGMTLNFLGEIYERLGDTSRAIDLFHQAIRSDSSTITRSTSNLYLAQLSLRQGDARAAIGFAEAALRNARMESNNLADRAEALQYLAESYKLLGHFDKALEYHEQYKATNDSLPKNAGLQDFYKIMVESEREKLAEKQQEADRERKMKLWFVGAAVLFWGIGAMLFFLYRTVQKKKEEIARQKEKIEELNETLEERVESRTQELKQANEELIQKNREISEALVRGQTMERKRVAAELHDNLGGLLAATRMTIKALDPKNLTVREQEIYSEVLSMMGEAYQEVRYISHNMLPEELEKHGLVESLTRLVRVLNNGRGQTRFDLTVKGLDGRLSREVEFNLYNVCLELCNNILKHAEAQLAEIVVEKTAETLNVTVQDNGRGFNIQGHFDGIGLKNIRERMEAIGGVMIISSSPQIGTRFDLSLAV
jgi:signal transduction histidine kinase